MPQSAAPSAVPQQVPQQSYRPPPVQDDGYGFRVVGDNTDSDSDSEQYSNGEPSKLLADRFVNKLCGCVYGGPHMWVW